MIKIVADSCCDFINEKKLFTNVKRVPLYINVNGKEFIDTENIDLENLLLNVEASKETPKTQCPSPESYIQAFEGEGDEIFVITISSKLSGSYNSALLAANIYLEDHPEKKIHVIDSLSASAGELVIVNQITELINEGYSYNAIIEKIEYLIKNENQLYFILENLDTLQKNGRLTKIQSLMASITKIKLLLKAKDGEPALQAKALSTKQALTGLIKNWKDSGIDLSQKILFISHCQAKEMAEDFKRKVLLRCNFRAVEIFETGGLSSVYANKGGLIIAY